MMSRKRRLVTIVSVAVLISLAVPTVAAQQVEVNQSVSTDSPNPGDGVSVSIEINATGMEGPALDVDIPADWEVVSHSTDGGSYNGQQNQWIWLSGGVYSPSYEVEVPDNASSGRYVLVAEASGIDPTTGNRIVDSVSTSVQVSGNNTNSLDFTYSPEEPGINETVRFEVTADEGDADSYEWSFGDGSTGEGETTTHTYTDRGSQVATLTAVYSDGSEETVQDNVFVGADDPPRSIPLGRPVAAFDYTPRSPAPDDTMTFNASASFDEQGEIADYEWDFDDDGEYETTGEVVERSFDQEGNYSVSLRVTDESGATNSSTSVVSVASSSGGGPSDGSGGPGSGGLPLSIIAGVVLVLGVGAVIVWRVK